MDKNVGKWFFIALFFFHRLVQADSLELRIVSDKGMPSHTIGVGTPCELEVHYHGTKPVRSTPRIKGLNAFTVRGPGVCTSIVNNVVDTTYTYRLQTDREGQYTIGPADIKIDDQLVYAQPITLSVIDAQKAQEIKEKYQESSEVIAQLIVDKQNVVVGEKIAASFRFCFRTQGIQLESVDESLWKSCFITTDNKHEQGTCTINGVRYNYIEWLFNVYPKEPGTLVVPAYAVHFVTPSVEGVRRGYFIPSFFDSRKDHKTVYSNAVQINVEALPPSNHSVTTVGSFLQFCAHLKPAAAKKGEAMVLCLSLEGDSTERIEKYILHNLPNNIKWYESKIYNPVVDGKEQKNIKCFEYIIQGMESGDWQIPAQEFHFFDVNDRVYKTLKTGSLFFTIMPDETRSYAPPVVEKKQKIDADDMHNKNNGDGLDNNRQLLAPLHKDGLWYACAEWQLPWWLFWIVVSFLLCIRALVWYKNIFNARKFHSSKAVRKRYALRILKKTLKQARKKKEVHKIYGCYVDFFATYLQKQSTSVLQQTMYEAVAASGCSESDLEAWDAFLGASMHATFADEDERIKKEDFFVKADYWVTMLEKHV